jgi:hypothetical protein
MNIPLDNLYHWIQSIAQHPVMLYVFRPHGSKDIFDLEMLKTYHELHALIPIMICHDQEPLDFSFHKFDQDLDRLIKFVKHHYFDTPHLDEVVEIYKYTNSQADSTLTWLNILDNQDWTMLLHSEMNSKDVEDFANARFVPVYYWSHAVIARDWYRFAQFDLRLQKRNPTKNFLVYCRDWTPTREYRLKFLEMIVQENLTSDCVISTQHVNNQGVHLQDYQIKNTQFAVDVGAILNSIPDNTASSSSSADYDVDDITSTRVSVVLETVVDSKIHLTEKILRPIACAHPFLLAAGPGALKYLQHYGFKTFSEFWDESYDVEPDTVLRLEKIVATMKQIQHLTEDDWKKIQCVADYNQQHFFSEKFIDQVIQELDQNFNTALEFCLENCGNMYWRWRKSIRRTGHYKQWPNITKYDWSRRSIQALRQHRLRRSQNNSVPGAVE